MNFSALIPEAYASVDMTAFGNVVDPIITNVVYPVLELLFGLAILIFVWGVLQLVLGGDDEEKRERGKSTIKWGTVGLFIMVSAWGIIYLVSNTVKTL
ncbi:MAG: hypothetical protein KGI45_02345 [Patescibacteria group bacterium]|nr:hypothetical protein [Patescibacteria group bacterium]MDE1966891.1 hypothetical protein [Patescibacteria group bacterium]